MIADTEKGWLLFANSFSVLEFSRELSSLFDDKKFIGITRPTLCINTQTTIPICQSIYLKYPSIPSKKKHQDLNGGHGKTNRQMYKKYISIYLNMYFPVFVVD